MHRLKACEQRSADAGRELRSAVAAIIENVQESGDEALFRLNARYDSCTRKSLRVNEDEIQHAYSLLRPQELEDLRMAAENIRAFAKAQRATLQDLPAYSPFPGATLGHRVIPVESCCCYVPGGKYPLYSSALMLGIPAKEAGVRRICGCSPVVKGTNFIHPKTLVAMDIAGIEHIYAVGGAQAIAACAYGTESIAPVDLIVGPGNDYVTEAKRQCYGQVGVDFLAGPSEVLIIADACADARLIAADLLAQSEHDPGAKGILFTTSRELGAKVQQEVEKLLQTLGTAGIARGSWEKYGEIVLADTIDELIDLANDYAPEHLELQLVEGEAIAPRLFNYGSLFIGNYAAEVFGDYASGTNHTLPTLRASRYTGGVWVGTFLKTCTHQSFTKEAMQRLAPLASRLAAGEGLQAHALAAQLRFQ